jgi:hypothetical protein
LCHGPDIETPEHDHHPGDPDAGVLHCTAMDHDHRDVYGHHVGVAHVDDCMGMAWGRVSDRVDFLIKGMIMNEPTMDAIVRDVVNLADTIGMSAHGVMDVVSGTNLDYPVAVYPNWNNMIKTRVIEFMMDHTNTIPTDAMYAELTRAIVGSSDDNDLHND